MTRTEAERQQPCRQWSVRSLCLCAASIQNGLSSKDAHPGALQELHARSVTPVTDHNPAAGCAPAGGAAAACAPARPRVWVTPGATGGGPTPAWCRLSCCQLPSDPLELEWGLVGCCRTAMRRAGLWTRLSSRRTRHQRCRVATLAGPRTSAARVGTTQNGAAPLSTGTLGTGTTKPRQRSQLEPAMG